jgi:hypothetical protein
VVIEILLSRDQRRYGQFEIKRVSVYQINAQSVADGRSAMATAFRNLTRSSVSREADLECWALLSPAVSLTSLSLATVLRRPSAAT